MSVKNLQFTRIDDRLVHGQVCAAWLKAVGVKNLVIIDDATSEDSFMIEMFEMLLSKDIKISVLNENDGLLCLKKGLDVPSMLLVKEPATIMRLVDGGIIFDEINIGGLGMTGNRMPFHGSIAASSEEKDIFKQLIEKGVKLSVQTIPLQKPCDVTSLL